jgi:DNA-binding CsgD family transcriptional regulator
MDMRSEISPQRLSELIGAIYDCAITPEKWSATIDAIRLEFDFKGGGFYVYALPSGNTTLSYTTGIEATAVDRIASYDLAALVELWGGPTRVNQYPLGEPIVQSQATDRATWMGARYYAEWLKPRGIIDNVAIGVARDPVKIASLAFGRHESAGPIGEPELAGLRLLAPHIRRAVIISDLFSLKAIEASTFSTTIEGFAAGVVLVGEGLAIVHANAAAAKMLAASNPILSRQGKLGLRREVTNGALEAALLLAVQDEAKLGQKGIAIPARCEDGAPCVLHVLPLLRREVRPGLMQSAAAAIFVAPATSPPRLPTDALVLLYDLTPAETRVFELICEGRTQAEIASFLGVAPSTVKTHLLRVFDKTGCGRQADLVKLAASFTLPLW